jgi:hypothetical protein
VRLLGACLLLLLCLVTGADAQSVAGQSVQGYLNSSGKWVPYDTTGAGVSVNCLAGCSGSGGAVSTVPPIHGFGTLSATAASAALSGLTPGPNSAVWPTSPAQMFVINSPGSAGIVYVCPLGGTCSATVGIPLSVGQSYALYQPSTSMTVFAVSTATVVAQW